MAKPAKCGVKLYAANNLDRTGQAKYDLFHW